MRSSIGLVFQEITLDDYLAGRVADYKERKQHERRLSPEELVGLVDFTYLTDMVTPEAAVELLRAQEPHRADRIAELERDGYPAYTTSAGWLGYDDDKIRALCREAIGDGFNAIKMKLESPTGNE